MAEEKRVEDLAIKKEAPKKPKPVVEKLPEKIAKLIEELKAKKGQLINQFLNLSFQVGELQDKQNETRRQVKETNNRIGKEVKRAFDKLKLKNRKGYRWGYNGGDSFVGTLIPEQPKKKEKKQI